MDKIERDEVIRLPKDDPDMAAAMRKAREALPQFRALWRAPRASTSHFAVKVGITDDAQAVRSAVRVLVTIALYEVFP